MSRPDTAVETFNGSHSCSQAVLLTYAPDYGISRVEAERLGAGFGGGMHLDGMCGAASAAIMILGLAVGGPDCDTGEGREDVTAAVQEFAERFRSSQGSLDCFGILGCDTRTPEGKAAAKERDLYNTVCPAAVRESALILDDILSRA